MASPHRISQSASADSIRSICAGAAAFAAIHTLVSPYMSEVSDSSTCARSFRGADGFSVTLPRTQRSPSHASTHSASVGVDDQPGSKRFLPLSPRQMQRATAHQGVSKGFSERHSTSRKLAVSTPISSHESIS